LPFHCIFHSIKVGLSKITIDILTPIRFGGPQKWGNDLVLALRSSGISAINIHNFWGVMQRFFYTKADIIHTTLPLFFNLQGKQIVLTLKGDYRKEGYLARLLYPLAIKRATFITVPNQYLKSLLGIERALVIPNGVFLEPFKSLPNNNETIVFVIVTGFHFWEKARGVLEIMKALELVKMKTDKKLLFTIVGGGKYLEKVKLEAKKFDVQTRFIGFHPNPKEILKNSDVFVYCSFLDVFPNVILDALVEGLPIVTNDFPAFIEFSEHFKTASLKHGMDSFSNIIIEILNKNEGRIKYDLSEYDWYKTVNNYTVLYDKLKRK
jgi:glycosyltransferase involved in cell wall biosynthesis